MSFFVYILKCRDGSYYTGHTDDLDRRIAEHQSGLIEGYTHQRLPVELMWSEDFQTRIEALEGERKIKGWSRAKKEALFVGDWERVSQLARKPSRNVLRYAISTSSMATQDQRDVERAVRKESVTSRIDDNAPPSPFALSSGEESEPVEDHRRVSKGRAHPKPIIVLVRPQLGENIGKAARAMLNFGLAELRLVAPRDGWPNPDVGPAASGADRVLAEATVHDSLAEAVADCRYVYATTVRRRGVTKPVVTPAEAATQVHAQQGRSAFVFGPERSGLETDDVALARYIVTVPINPAFGSLNLAQAVMVLAYEWSKGETLASPPTREIDPPAPQVELEGLYDELEAMLAPTSYFFPPIRAAVTKRTLRGILTKPGWNSGEVRTLRGVLSALKKQFRS